jgi:hypothetical protein
MKPAWMLRKDAERREQWEADRLIRRLQDRITDVCWDIDVWLDLAPGTTHAETVERLGSFPSLVQLQREIARLLRQASLRGRPVEQEVAA